jgi:HD superfamily phosphodiesterase
MTSLSVLYAFVEQMCTEYNIDESHDVTHARDCVNFAEAIMEWDITGDELKIIRYAAALHDCVDKKYVPPEEATAKVRTFLLGEGWASDHVEAVLNIINTMSYSYLNKQLIDGRPSFPDHGPWQRAYHTVRQADLLCSYRVHRCYLYQRRIHPTMTDSDSWQKVNALFQVRMFKYVQHGWIHLPKALALVPNLIKIAQADLEAHV